jgi:hypothetical protein
MCADVLVAAGLALAPPPHVTLAVDLSRTPPMPPAQLRAMSEEASAIWHRYGVSLLWVTGDTVPGHRRPQMMLTVVDQSTGETDGPAARARPLGGIVFFEGRLLAEARISVSVDAISEVVESGTWLGRDVLALPGTVRYALVGRALGRVLAHEIGHYLLAWRNHAAKGLMRPSFSRRLLIDPNRVPFEVTEFFVPRLRDRLTQLAVVGSPRPSAP